MFIIHAGRLIDGSGNPPLLNQYILVRGDRIEDIGGINQIEAPEDAVWIDASDKTVMPGMIDTHVHIMWNVRNDFSLSSKERMITSLPGTLALQSYHHSNLCLEAGFTTLRDMGCRDFVDISLRDAILQGVVNGPRLSVCGYGLTSTGGHMDATRGLRPDIQINWFNNVVDTPDQARIATRTLIKMGVDHIKIIAGTGYQVRERPRYWAPEMRRDVMQAICEEAHTAGRTVAAHSQGSEGELWAVQSGVDCLEHGHFLTEETLDLMAEKGTFLVPTVTHNAFGLRSPNRKYYEVSRASLEKVVPLALKKGVRVAAGTDSGAGVPHGSNALELELLVELGMSPMQAIHAATGLAAEVLDMGHLTGTLQAGKYADLLVVNGSPEEDVRLLQEHQNIQLVMKSGKVLVDRRRLTDWDGIPNSKKDAYE